MTTDDLRERCINCHDDAKEEGGKRWENGDYFIKTV